MRKLTAGQKNALKKEVKKYYEIHNTFPISLDELDNVLKIDNMNPNELFWQNAERFIDDLRWNIQFDYMFKGR
jgi:hypothetical protein